MLVQDADTTTGAVEVLAVQAVVGGIRRRLAALPPHQLDAGIDETLSSLGEVLDVDRTYVFVIDGDRTSNTHEWCENGISPQINELQDLPISTIAAWLPTLRAGEAVTVEDVATLPDDRADERELLAAQEIKSLLVVPMMSFGDLLGFVGFDAVRDLRTFSPTEVALLRSVAELVCTAWVGREARSSVGRAQARVEELLRHVDDLLLLLDGDGVCTWVSASCQQVGIRPDRLVGIRPLDLLVDEDGERVRELLRGWRRADGAEPATIPEVQLVTPLGIRWVAGTLRDLRHVPGVEGDLLTLRDVTERRHSQATNRRQATSDPLTGLANRTALRARLRDAVATHEAGFLGVLLLDLDHFKLVNDSRGHAAGDDLLQQAGGRLARVAGDGATVARFGGDEFVVLLQGTDAQEVLDAAELCRRALTSTFFLDGDVEELTCSLGLRLWCGMEPVDSSVLLRDADTALFVAKERGRDRLVVFDEQMAQLAARRSRVAGRLRDVLEHGGLHAEYQPIVDLCTLEVVGVEALARWDDPQLGRVSPTEFIPIAEDVGLVSQLGLQMLTEATRAFASWPTPLTVSVNVSARQLEDPDLARQFAAILRAAGMPPSRVRVEVTESMLMRDPVRARTILTELRELGLTIALDDFGTGHSSLAVLRDLPLDVLKIDRAFVGSLHEDPTGGALVRTIVSMAHTFGLRTVAEGVELESHAVILRDAGVDLSQGWLHGRPVPYAELAALLLGSSLAARA